MCVLAGRLGGELNGQAVFGLFEGERLEIPLPGDTPLRDRPLHAEGVRRFAYQSPESRWIIRWDHDKHVNHSCHANMLNTPHVTREPL